jgi:hypothetical protein
MQSKVRVLEMSMHREEHRSTVAIHLALCIHFIASEIFTRMMIAITIIRTNILLRASITCQALHGEGDFDQLLLIANEKQNSDGYVHQTAYNEYLLLKSASVHR